MLTSREILKSMRDVIEPVGFKLSGTTFHRVNDAQFIELVNLQGGVRHLSGKSAVNLGVFIPEVWEILGKAESLQNARSIRTPRTYDCAIEMRLSVLVFGRDNWFDRNDPTVARKISDLISSHALPWFAALDCLSSIKNALADKRFRRQVAWGTHAAILKAAGDAPAARSFLAQLHDVDPINVKVFASRIGLD